MSEEEIIKKFIEEYNASYPDEKEWVAIYPEQIQAIQGLLNLYNKEKEKNKELRNYISKDKIREKIKELEKEQENNRSDLKYAIDMLNFKMIDKISDMIVINMYLRDFLQLLLERR